MGHIDVNQVGHTLPDGRPLLDEMPFRVGEGSKTALIGANGAGKSTLLRLLRGDAPPHSGAVTVEGELGVIPQFVGHVRDTTTVHELLVSVAPAAVRRAHAELERAEEAMMGSEDEKTQMRYAEAITDYMPPAGISARHGASGRGPAPRVLGGGPSEKRCTCANRGSGLARLVPPASRRCQSGTGRLRSTTAEHSARHPSRSSSPPGSARGKWKAARVPLSASSSWRPTDRVAGSSVSVPSGT